MAGCQSAYAADSTIDSTRVGFSDVSVVSEALGSGVPVGTVIIWTQPTNPSEGDWLECNGQFVDESLYPELHAMMPIVPDYRGLFLRGYGSQQHLQNNGSTVGETLTTHASLDLGELQGDAMREMEGDMGYASNKFISLVSGIFEGVWYGRNNSPAMGATDSATVYSRGRFKASRQLPIDNEIRPANRAVRYLIKAS